MRLPLAVQYDRAGKLSLVRFFDCTLIDGELSNIKVTEEPADKYYDIFKLTFQHGRVTESQSVGKFWFLTDDNNPRWCCRFIKTDGVTILNYLGEVIKEEYSQVIIAAPYYYAIDYQGKVFKLTYKELIKLKVLFGNIKTTAERTKPVIYTNYCCILPLYADNLNQYGKELDTQGTMTGSRYELHNYYSVNALDSNIGALAIPKGVVGVDLNDSDKTKNIKSLFCPEMMNIVHIDLPKNNLVTAKLPRYVLQGFTFKAGIVDTLVFPEKAFSTFILQLNDYNEPEMKLPVLYNMRTIAIQVLFTAPKLKSLRLKIPQPIDDSVSVFSIYIKEAPKLEEVVLNSPKYNAISPIPYNLNITIGAPKYNLKLNTPLKNLYLQIPEELPKARVTIYHKGITLITLDIGLREFFITQRDLTRQYTCGTGVRVIGESPETLTIEYTNFN